MKQIMRVATFGQVPCIASSFARSRLQRSIQRRKPHALDHDTVQFVRLTPTLGVLGEKVAILLDDRITIWNWKLGCVIRIIPSLADAFAFVDSDSIAVMSCTENAIHLVSLPQTGPDMAANDNLECGLLAALALPRVRADKSPTFASFYSHRSSKSPHSDSLRQTMFPDWPGLNGRCPQFRADPSKHVVCFAVGYEQIGPEEPDDEWSLCFMIRYPTLRKFLLKGLAKQEDDALVSPAQGSGPDHQLNPCGPPRPQHSRTQIPLLVPWSEWAPYARCFMGTTFETMLNLPEHVRLSLTHTFHLDLQGLRAALTVPGPEQSPPLASNDDTSPQGSSPGETSDWVEEVPRIRILDFNPSPIKRELGGLPQRREDSGYREHTISQNEGYIVASPFWRAPLHGPPSLQTIVATPDHIEYPELLEEPIVCGSKLPFRYVTSEETITGSAHSGLLLDDERIIELDSVLSNDKPGALVVLTM